MNVILKKTPGVSGEQIKNIGLASNDLRDIATDDLTTYVFTTTRRDGFSIPVKVVNLIMDLPYLYPQSKMLDSIELMKEYAEVLKAMKVIEKVAGKRAYEKRKARRAQKEKKSE